MAAPKGHPPYNKNGEGGRPIKYTPELINELADKFELWMKNEENIWYEDFLLENDLGIDIPSELAKRSERFSEVYQKSKIWQRSKLVKGGLLNNYNSSITKLVLGNTSGWSDKVDSKLSGDSEHPLAFACSQFDNSSQDLVNETHTVTDRAGD